jgi:hypothetical protein
MVIWFRLIAGNLIGSGGAMGSSGAASEPAVKAAREIANCRRVNLPIFTSLSILSIVSIMSDLLRYRVVNSNPDCSSVHSIQKLG